MNKYRYLGLLALVAAASGTVKLSAVEGGDDNPPGPVVETVLREQLEVWPAGEAIVTRLELPANFSLSRHYHPGEEIIYAIEGDGWIHYPDKPDVHVSAGESARIPARQIHSGSAGEKGLRAIIFRVHVKGEPVRVDVTDSP